ncbi:MAG: flavin prenyltransferase UbiX [Bacillota bacterium]
MKIIVGITGASGSIYGISTMRLLSHMGIETHVVVTEAGEKVMDYECKITRSYMEKYCTWHNNNDLFSPIASGTYKCDAMVIVPCSMNTLGSIANGCGNSLLNRAAGVMLKEKRKLIIVPRETPLSTIHLQNMLRLSQAGAHILPASPGFYHMPKDLSDIVNFMVTKIMDLLEINCNLIDRWGE